MKKPKAEIQHLELVSGFILRFFAESSTHGCYIRVCSEELHHLIFQGTTIGRPNAFTRFPDRISPDGKCEGFEINLLELLESNQLVCQKCIINVTLLNKEWMEISEPRRPFTEEFYALYNRQLRDMQSGANTTINNGPQKGQQLRSISMPKPVEPKVEKGHILTYWADPGTPKSFVVVKNPKGEKVISEAVLHKRAVTPARGPLIQFQVEIMSLNVLLGKKFNPKLKNTYRVALADASGAVDPDGFVDADSTEVDPPESKGRSTWYKLVAVVGLLIIAYFIGRWKTQDSGNPVGAEVRTLKDNFAKAQDEIKTLTKALAEKPGTTTVEKPPATQHTAAQTPAPIIIVTNVMPAEWVNVIKSNNFPSVNINVTNGSGTVNTFINSTLSGGLPSQGRAKQIPPQTTKTRKVKTGWLNTQPLCTFDIFQGISYDPRIPAQRRDVIIPAGADYSYPYPPGSWVVSFEGSFATIQSAYDIRSDDETQPDWEFTANGIANTGNVRAVRLHNVGSADAMITFVVTPPPTS